MGKRLDLVGQKFGRLEVISFFGIQKKESTWFCKCDCGNEKIKRGMDLKSGNTKSCGCLSTERKTKHGMWKTPEYKVWQGMIARCHNPNNSKYEYYGGRGIKVCEAWRRFENFIKDMGKRPTGLTLERNNTNGDYCPENCRWATRSDQNLNTNLNKIKTSKYRGVSFDKTRNKWKAYLTKERKYIGLGRFDNELDAAEKATEAYYNYHGKFPPEFKPIPIPERLKCI
ncbi:MAG: AP2 domain-containing protein [Bacteriovoracales bacterium]